MITDGAAPPTARRSVPDAEFAGAHTVAVESLCASGHPVDEIRICAIGTEEVCSQTYKRYCKNSEIPDHERLRSNSLSRPDNIWGFPGYAMREVGKGIGVKGIFQLLANRP